MGKVNKRSCDYKAGLLVGMQQQGAIDVQASVMLRQAKEAAEAKAKEAVAELFRLKAKVGGSRRVTRMLYEILDSAGVD